MTDIVTKVSIGGQVVPIGGGSTEGEAHEFITQEEYEQLTPTQKTEKVYMITGEGSTGGGGSAEDTSYDNTTSGLTATNVQDAIDEVVQRVSGRITKDNDVTVAVPSSSTEVIENSITAKREEYCDYSLYGDSVLYLNGEEIDHGTGYSGDVPKTGKIYVFGGDVISYTCKRRNASTGSNLSLTFSY